ncbi:hypothetical protein [Pseudomonas putida]|uniref:hypothetical protein n=1 Tax=Pseudomonas putida TaxID=303 RepID=UPI0039057C4C
MPIPAHLAQPIREVQRNSIVYAGRTQDVAPLSGCLAGGVHPMAEYKAKRIIEL